jgi:hypothetical protein
MLIQNFFFRMYSALTFLATYFLLQKCLSEHQIFYDRVVALTSNKLNLVLLINFVIALLSNFSSVFVYFFFNQIRTLERRVSSATPTNPLHST